MVFRKITIVGLGLMGGALAASCRKSFPRAIVAGVSRNPAALRTARKKKWIHSATRDLCQGIQDSDLVVLCTPVDVILKQVREIDRFAKKGALVTDIGSAKAPISSAIHRRSWKNIRFISSHPMVGSHQRGIEAARENLYRDGFCFLIQSPAQDQTAFRAVFEFWKKICGKVIPLSVREHDRIVAGVSHVPHVLAAALVTAIPPEHLRFAASGFRDTTRIAMGHPSVWAPILCGNRVELSRRLRSFQKHLEKILLQIEDPRRGGLLRTLKNAGLRRSQI